MIEANKTVFISYRRKLSAFVARAVFMDLREHGYDAFLDVETIDSGAFDTIILNQIAARAHFILILTPGSLDRCLEPDDWLRREIEHAMDLQRNIVPLLINNFSFNDAQTFLTGKLSALMRYNALNVPHEYFDEAMARLRTRYLKPPAAIPLIPTPLNERFIVEQKIQQAATIDTVVVPARKAGVDRTFLSENRWYAVRINEMMRPLIKYCALYQVAPHSAITHIAPVASIEPWPDEPTKVVINFAEKAQTIEPITLVKNGRIKPLYNLRYTTHEKIKLAKTLDDIW